MTDTSTLGQGSTPPPDALLLGRYRLVDRVADAGGTSFWRATDQRLARPVGVRLMALDDPGAPALRESVTQASLVSDRRSVPILDIVDDRDSGLLVIIVEWVTGTPLGDFIAARRGDPLAPAQAASIALEVARFLSAAQAVGLSHGRIHPNTVMITDSGEIRVRGLGVDRTLCGVDPDLPPEIADVHGAGAVLYAGLTGRWPGPVVHDRLAAVPLLDHGRPPWPSRVVADIPGALDEVAARALQTTQPPKGTTHFSSIEEVITALGAALTAAPVEPQGPPRRTAVRVGSVALFGIGCLALGWLGISLLLGMGAAPLTTPRATPPLVSVSSAPVAVAPSGSERDLPIVSAIDYDPFGDTKHENPDQVHFAIDADPGTAWHTVRYKNATLSGKPGVGIVVDLGVDRPVAAVSLGLVGSGTDLSILAGEDPTLALAKWTPMGMDATAASNSVLLRVPRPIMTRYLLIFLTQIPPVDGSFQGGVSDVHVRG